MKKAIFIVLFIAGATFSVFAQWTDDPLENTVVNDLGGSQVMPHIAYDVNGNFYVGFYSNESGNYDIRLQYYTFDGTAQWDADGLLVSDHPQNSWVTDWDLATDNDGNCVLAFNDVRDGDVNVYTYAISPTGDFLWGADGVALTNDPGFEAVPSIAVASDNNVIVVWSRPTSTEAEVVMQKISPDGTLSWGDSGITYQDGSYNYAGPRVLGVEDGSYIMAFYKETGNFPYLTRHIYVQKFDEAGTPMWEADVLASNANGISSFNNFTIASDNADGIIIAWTDDRDNDMNLDGSVQRVLSDGSILWPANGSEVSTANNYSHQNVQILGVNSNDEVLVTWSKKNSNQSETAIAGQKFSTTGEQQWTTDGIEFILMSANISGTIGGSVFDGTSAIIAYDEFISGYYYSHINALAVDDEGNMIWSPSTTLMAAKTTEKIHIVNSLILNEQLIVVWEEAGTDIYMQNIYTDGTMGPLPVSDDATLSELTVDGESVTDFSPDTYYYEVDVPEGQAIPVIDGVPNNINASLEITQASDIPGDGIIVVTAEDEITQLTYSVHFNLITSIIDAEEVKISIYPNPVTDRLYFSGTYGKYNVKIINILGEEVITTIIDNDQYIATDFLKEGIYFAIIQQKDEKVYSLKFVKK